MSNHSLRDRLAGGETCAPRRFDVHAEGQCAFESAGEGDPQRMMILFISVIIFLLILAAGYAGLHVQRRLADEHKTGGRAASSVR
jgi:hypothetical protein